MGIIYDLYKTSMIVTNDLQTTGKSDTRQERTGAYSETPENPNAEVYEVEEDDFVESRL